MEDRTQFTLFWIDCEVLLCTGIMPVHLDDGSALHGASVCTWMQLWSTLGNAQLGGAHAIE